MPPAAKEPPFPPVLLSPAQRRSARTLVDARVRQTLLQFDALTQHNQQLQHQQRGARGLTPETREWKLVKTRESVSVYKSLVSGASNSPTLLGVGTLAGSLDDVLYGCMAPSAAGMKLRERYLHRDESSDGDHALLDAHVLYDIDADEESQDMASQQHQQLEQPLRFLGVKWAVHGSSARLRRLVSRPRDVVYIEGVGTLAVREAGNRQRIGYHVMHSVELPECPALESSSRSYARDSVASVLLFKETPDKRSVEFYMTTQVSPSGVKAAVRATLAVNRLALCGQSKKLAWMLRETVEARLAEKSHAGQATELRLLAKPNAGATMQCPLCTTEVSTYRTLTCCQLCETEVCSRCLVNRTLAYARSNTIADITVVTMHAQFCKHCVTRTNQTSAADIAQRELGGAVRASEPKQPVSNSRDSRGSERSSLAVTARDSSVGDACSSAPLRRRDSSRSVTSSVATSASPTSSVSPLSTPAWTPIDESAVLHADPSAAKNPQPPLERPPQPQRRVQQARLQSPVQPPPPSPAVDEADHKRRLWLQMHQLRAAAEHAYQTTKRTGMAVRDVTHAPSPRVGGLF